MCHLFPPFFDKIFFFSFIFSIFLLLFYTYLFVYLFVFAPYSSSTLLFLLATFPAPRTRHSFPSSDKNNGKCAIFFLLSSIKSSSFLVSFLILYYDYTHSFLFIIP